jgi:hypothetical protein
LFKNDVPDFLNIKLDNIKGFNEKRLLKYLDNCKMLYLEKKLNNLLLVERKVSIENIVTIRKGFVIYKDTEYTVLLFDNLKNLYDEFTLRKLPDLSERAMDVLFSEDIVEYVKSKDYSFENFKQDGDYLEYWQNIGHKRVCVMRCRF